MQVDADFVLADALRAGARYMLILANASSAQQAVSSHKTCLRMLHYKQDDAGSVLAAASRAAA